MNPQQCAECPRVFDFTDEGEYLPLRGYACECCALRLIGVTDEVPAAGISGN